MIDISDGLAQDLGHILKASAKGACLELTQLPLDPALQRLPEQQQWRYALAGGDDYELCFTISPEHYQQLLQRQPNVQTTVIGQIIQTPTIIFNKNGQAQPLDLKGYQHFA